MKIDITRPVKTRAGEPVEIISDRGRAVSELSGRAYNLIGYIGNSRVTQIWTADGKYDARSDTPRMNDLVQECELWVNVYPGCHGVYPTKDAAMGAQSTPIARIRVPYTPGQFD